MTLVHSNILNFLGPERNLKKSFFVEFFWRQKFFLSPLFETAMVKNFSNNCPYKKRLDAEGKAEGIWRHPRRKSGAQNGENNKRMQNNVSYS